LEKKVKEHEASSLLYAKEMMYQATEATEKTEEIDPNI
jgi:hypothetical protein